MIRQLKDIAHIRAGYPFRGRIIDDPKGTVRVIQMKDVDPVEEVNWQDLTTAQLTGRKRADWLEPGDLLFVARGNHNFALHLEEIPMPAVLSPHFFHLSIRPNMGVLPGFLAWQINQEPSQQYLRKSAEGTQVLNIRRQVLEELPVVVPPLEKQEAISQLDNLWRREQQVFNALSDNLKQIMNGLAQQILHA